ncbi:MAG: SDR family oxidoreductase [Clostridiales bacterium]|nr:SDR family oxidoreductase [Clostridiales bacterium]
MNIMITGAQGFMGRNLQQFLNQRPNAADDVIFPIDLATDAQELHDAAKQADFVFHLAGVNRPENTDDFMRGNSDFTKELLSLLQAAKKPPVLLSSSTQAGLQNPYGQSKRAAELEVREYGERCGTPVYIYRLTNAFGKWSRPNYNSVVATYCYAISRGMPISVSNPDAPLHFNYIDDIAAEFIRALDDQPTRENEFCVVSPTHDIKLGELAALIRSFDTDRKALNVPDQSDPFTKKLYSTYLSFLPPEDFANSPSIHSDHRGSFTELFHMGERGQVSVNISKPHITKGEHWHHSKHEKFVVVVGEGIIRFRKIGDTTVISYRVSGDAPQIVDIPPGYTHNIENLGDCDMVTIMWANECFDPSNPDTIYLPVAAPSNQQRKEI